MRVLCMSTPEARLRVVRLDLPRDAVATDAMMAASPSLALTVEPATGKEATARGGIDPSRSR